MLIVPVGQQILCLCSLKTTTGRDLVHTEVQAFISALGAAIRAVNLIQEDIDRFVDALVKKEVAL